MNTFKVGDRVHHAFHGSATVTDVDEALKLVTVRPDKYRGGERVRVHPISLTPVRKPVVSGKIKIGDRVSHRLHPDGTVEEIDLTSGLFTVSLGGSRAYRALEHQITPAQPEPKFTLTVTDSDGFTGTVGPFPKDQIDAVLTGGFDWDTVESITITRAKG